MRTICFLCQGGGGTSYAYAIDFSRYLKSKGITDIEVSHATPYDFSSKKRIIRIPVIVPENPKEPETQGDYILGDDIDLFVPSADHLSEILLRRGCEIPITEGIDEMSEKNENDPNRYLEEIYRELERVTQPESTPAEA